MGEIDDKQLELAQIGYDTENSIVTIIIHAQRDSLKFRVLGTDQVIKTAAGILAKEMVELLRDHLGEKVRELRSQIN